MKNILLVLLGFYVLPCAAQIQNGDFENWHNDTTSNIKLDGWKHYHNNTDMTTYGHMMGTAQISPGYHGAYALKLTRWYASNYDHITQSAPFTEMTSGLAGYYFYTNADLSATLVDNTIIKDSAVVTVVLTKWNTGTAHSDTIGYGSIKLPETTDYAPFKLSVNYTVQTTPDSIHIDVVPTAYTIGNSPLCHNGGDCSFLTIDNLYTLFPATIAGVTRGQFRVYPNPVKNIVTIETPGVFNKRAKMVITDMIGQQIQVRNIAGTYTDINMSSFASGVYMLTVRDETGVLYTGKLTRE